MKTTIENKKGLEKDVKVFVDKKTISGYLEEKYEEIKKDVVLKGFRPGKVPTEILKKKFGKSVYGEIIDKVLKDTSTKALEENKIKPAGQPKIDLKTFGEGKDLEYTISVTEFPKVEVNSLNNIKINEYIVKIKTEETDKRIEQIAKTQNNFKEAEDDYASKNDDLVVFDYKATVDGKDFKGNEGKGTQLVLGKDLFIKGFDKQLNNVKKNENKKVEVNLPDSFPEKELINKKAIFDCIITSVKKPEKVKINDDFAKNLGAKDLNNLLHEKFTLANINHMTEEGSKIDKSVIDYINNQFDPSMNWKDAEYCVKKWNGPFALKGVMSVEDAKRAIDIGCTAIMISNHGGRQLDGSRAPFDQLAEIVDAVGDKIEVILDGGVRRGTHVLKALSLGAKACSFGKGYLFALGAAGQKGVEAILQKMKDEIKRDMTLMGCRSVKELDRSKVKFRNK